MASLLVRIGTFTGTNNEPDIIRWSHNTDGKFSVTRVYKRGLSELTGRDRGPWKAIWRSMAPNKVKYFSWLVVRKACLTHEALQKKKLNLASVCSLCMEAIETNSHFVLHCKVTSQVWVLIHHLGWRKLDNARTNI